MRQVNLRAVDLNLLVALDVLLEERHISRAAQRLGMSQPSMSRALTRLRETFDDPLLVRAKQNYVPTRRAQEIAVSLKPALEHINAAFAAPEFDPATARGQIRLSALDYPEIAILPGLMTIVREQAPNVRVDVMQKAILSIDEIADGKADISIGMMPTSLPKHLKLQPLYQDEYVCVMDRDHPAARGPLRLDAYVGHPHSVVHTGRTSGGFIDDALQKLGARRIVQKRSVHFIASLLSIVGTDLLQTAPRRLANVLADKHGLVVRQLPFEVEPISVSMLWHARNDHNQMHSWFRDRIAAVAGGSA